MVAGFLGRDPFGSLPHWDWDARGCGPVAARHDEGEKQYGYRWLLTNPGPFRDFDHQGVLERALMASGIRCAVDGVKLTNTARSGDADAIVSPRI